MNLLCYFLNSLIVFLSAMYVIEVKAGLVRRAMQVRNSSGVSNALILAVCVLTCSRLLMILLGLSNAYINLIAILLFLDVSRETLGFNAKL